MARATVEYEEPTVHLVLTKAEAETLYDITLRIGGSEAFSRRRHMAAIAAALRLGDRQEVIGFTYRNYGGTKYAGDMQPGAIAFRDE